MYDLIARTASIILVALMFGGGRVGLASVVGSIPETLLALEWAETDFLLHRRRVHPDGGHRVGEPASAGRVKTRRMVDQRARLLRAAVGFALVPPSEPEHDIHRCCGELRALTETTPL
jgi:hypothetical protein